MKKNFLSTLTLSSLLPLASATAQDLIAYQIEANQPGNQAATVALGLDFNLISEITVNQLGSFDDNGDGFNNPITVELWSRNDGGTPEDRGDDFGENILATLTFDSGSPGTLIGGHRFKDLTTPLSLAAGSYTIVAVGFGEADQNYNTNTPPGLAPLSGEDGGVLEYFGRRFGDGYPANVDGGLAARYGAGTFAYELKDTDNDGLPDFWEDLYSLDKNSDADAGADPDGDELTNLEEFEAGALPNDDDSDDDNSKDGNEITAGTDPMNPDSDFDGLLDGAEDNSGTFTDEDKTGSDPLLPDSDLDGYDDGLEVELLSDPTNMNDTPRADFGELAYAADKALAGNQATPISIGLDFDVDGKITIGHLGAFDDNSDGFTNPITVEIWERNNNDTPDDPVDDSAADATPLTSVVINPGEGFLQGNIRLKALSVPLEIDTSSDPKSYTVVAFGFSGDDQNYNSFGGLNGPTTSSNIALNYVGRGRYASGGASGVFPDVVDGGPANRYGGGTFAFTAEDADGDGMPDFWEILYGLDPDSAADAALDGDNDDLTNLQEFVNDLDPTNADTDDDDLDDGAELTAGTDPRNPDSDGDSLTDGAEANGNSDPLLVDTDSDDFTDNREIAAGTNPNDANDKPTVRVSGSLAYLAGDGLTGNQTNFAGSVGLDFVVADPITVTELGSFDSGGDGFTGEITVQLWSRDDGGTPDEGGDDTGIEALAEIVFNPANRGDLRDSYRTQRLASPLGLAPGSYTIVASGYGPNDPLSNLGQPNPPTTFTTTDDPAIAFVGGGRYLGASATFPTNPDGGPENRYAAGNFAFQTASTTPTITEFVWNPENNSGTITFNSLPGTGYEIEFSTDLTAGSWSGLDDLVADENETTTFISVPAAVGDNPAFFRVKKLE